MYRHFRKYTLGTGPLLRMFVENTLKRSFGLAETLKYPGSKTQNMQKLQGWVTTRDNLNCVIKSQVIMSENVWKEKKKVCEAVAKNKSCVGWIILGAACLLAFCGLLSSRSIQTCWTCFGGRTLQALSVVCYIDQNYTNTNTKNTNPDGLDLFWGQSNAGSVFLTKLSQSYQGSIPAGLLRASIKIHPSRLVLGAEQCRAMQTLSARGRLWPMASFLMARLHTSQIIFIISASNCWISDLRQFALALALAS